ncbi:MAG: glutaredoxin [Candidatus Endobugula sp.]|jgi:glutaredoxin
MSKTATLYRMINDQHICPFGLKAKDLLRRQGFAVDDHSLGSREDIDAFKTQHKVTTTPQIFINEERIGGYDDLRKYFNLSLPDKSQVTYRPVIAIFAVSLLMAVGLHSSSLGSLLSAGSFTLLVELSINVVEAFIAIAMCVLAIQKLRDLEGFSNQFITYDLFGMRVVRYAYIYPFAEAVVGIGMLANITPWLISPIALFIGGIGAISVIKAVYIDHRELKCACVGGNSNVPLGVVSLTENIAMVAMGIWMLV